MASRAPRSDPAAIVALLSGPGRSELARFLTRQRWFAAKTRGVGTLEVVDWAVLDREGSLLLLLLAVDGDRYYIPVALGDEAPPDRVLARRGAERVVDAHDDARFGPCLLRAIAAGDTLGGRRGRFACRPTPGWVFPPDAPVRPGRRLTGEQSNTCLAIGDLVLKSLRRPPPGVSPDLEITRFLTARTGFRHVPRLAGWLEYTTAAETATLAVLHELVPNTGDGWTHLVSTLSGRGAAVGRGPDPLVDDLRQLGAVTGALHAALASDDRDPDFRPEPVTRADVARWAADITRELAPLALWHRLGADRGLVDEAVARTLAGLETLVEGTLKIRIHGDYHLGQVLKTADAFVVIDFEGEPARPLSERRLKQPALRDMAGMLRSLDYAAHAVARARPEEERPGALTALIAWEEQAREACLAGYLDALAGTPAALVPAGSDPLRRACAAFELQKAGYELRYEMDNRPDWLPIPLAGIDRILRQALGRGLR